MESLSHIAGAVGLGLGIAAIVLLCLGGIAMSALSLSGTWVVLLAAIVAALIHPHPFPGIWTLVAFGVAAILVEVIEAVAGTWGVMKRGGSRAAGFAAMAGGLVGLLLGSAAIPIIGGLLGMIVGSFACTYAVERYRLKQAEPAANIAFGAVTSRVLVVLLKVVVTLGMAAVLLIGLFRWIGFEAGPGA